MCSYLLSRSQNRCPFFPSKNGFAWVCPDSICINYVNFVNLPSEILRQTKTSGHLECRVKFLHPLAEGCPESLRGPWRRSQWNLLKPYGHYGFQWNLSKWISVNYMKSKCIIWIHYDFMIVSMIMISQFTIILPTMSMIPLTYLPRKELLAP